MKQKLLLQELSRYEIGTYADIIYRNALLYPNEPAFKCRNENVTFLDFNKRVNRLIHALQGTGTNKGSVLGILSWNCLEYTEIYGAAMKAGFIASPFNSRLQEEELEYLINYSETDTLFIDPDFVEMISAMRSRIGKVKQIVVIGNSASGMISYSDLTQPCSGGEPDISLSEDDPVFLFYTSGTTGTPRAALYTQAQAMEDTRKCTAALFLEQADKQIQIMPLFHIGGTKNLWGFYFVGATNVIMPQKSFDPRATLQAIQEERATDIHIVPTHLAAFLDLPEVDQYDLTCMKRMFYAASPMPLESLKKGMEKWGPIFLQGYGATEYGPNVTMLSIKQHGTIPEIQKNQAVLRSAGIPHIGVHVRILDENKDDVEPNVVGEIVVKSKGVMKEWWKNPQETAKTIVNGWVHTGDMGRYDEQGYIYIVDRKKDMIVSGGENIFPREVEEILYAHPNVTEAAVFGIPDPYWVEKVHAVVVLKKGLTATEEELIDYCKEHLARFKAPKSVEFMDGLPKNPTGKILKRQLRTKYWEGQGRMI
jgi:long-chain acyl-CoA synthetase